MKLTESLSAISLGSFVEGWRWPVRRMYILLKFIPDAGSDKAAGYLVQKLADVCADDWTEDGVQEWVAEHWLRDRADSFETWKAVYWPDAGARVWDAVPHDVLHEGVQDVGHVAQLQQQHQQQLCEQQQQQQQHILCDPLRLPHKRYLRNSDSFRRQSEEQTRSWWSALSREDKIKIWEQRVGLSLERAILQTPDCILEAHLDSGWKLSNADLICIFGDELFGEVNS